MSLKAKIEAVIYASEEPVTLAQLISLLGQEGQTELDRADEAQPTLALDDIEPGADPTLAGEPSADEAIESAVEPEAANVPGAADEPTQAETMLAAPPTEPDPAAAASRAEKARAARLRTWFRGLLDQLIAEYATSDRGLEIREIAGGFRFATKPEYHDTVRGFVKSLKPPLKLSLQALETLAVVAYKQPVTAPEISEIRGVDSSGVLGSLISRKLITTAGRKQVIGRPILYKTTKEFLLKFGLKDISELPSIEEFEKMAGQMAEQEEIDMPDAADPRPNVEEVEENLESERDDHAPQADGDSTEPGAADNVPPEDKASIDGRISSLPPDYEGEEEQDNPSAQEAETQSRE
jgi:segregation and condensation protein B